MMEHQVILICLVALVHIKAASILDAGPYRVDQKQIVMKFCPVSSSPCLEGKFNRRRIAGTTDWLWNGSLRSIDLYYKPSSTMRVLVSIKGAKGVYENLIDLTRPMCAWYDIAKAILDDIALHAGYIFDCNFLFPGVYEAKNFILQPKKHLTSPMVPIAPYGSYKVDIRANSNYRLNCFCFQLLFDVVPDVEAIRNNRKPNRTSLMQHK